MPKYFDFVSPNISRPKPSFLSLNFVPKYKQFISGAKLTSKSSLFKLKIYSDDGIEEYSLHKI